MQKRIYKIRRDLAIQHAGKTLYRIESLIDDPKRGIEKGQLGGYIEGYKNLGDKAWVGDEAKVYENAKIFGYAVVSDFAEVYGNAAVANWAKVYGNARVRHYCRVIDTAQVYGKVILSSCSCVSGNAVVCEDAYIEEFASISGDAYVSGNACVKGNTSVSGLAQVRGNAYIRGMSQIQNDIIEKEEDVINIVGAFYPITITPKWMKIGCQCHTKAAWFNFKDKEIYAMDGYRALEFWRVWKPILKEICDAQN